MPAIDRGIDGGWSGAVKEAAWAALDLAAFAVPLSAEADRAQSHVRTSAGQVASQW